MVARDFEFSKSRGPFLEVPARRMRVFWGHWGPLSMELTSPGFGVPHFRKTLFHLRLWM